MSFSFPGTSKKHLRFGIILLVSLIIGILFNVYTNPPQPRTKTDPYAGLFDRKGPYLIQEKTLLENKAVPVLKISNEREKTVKLSKLSITSTIENGVAKTRYDMYFYNDQDRELEAELQFPLSDGQTISYFAMDVNGEMRPGVAVEKIKARMAYEATVRQGIDPGLVEKTVGNNFKLRVFPVPSKGIKHITVEYVHELTMDVKHAYYYLPLYFKEKIPNFHYQLSIIGEASKPNILRSCSDDFVLKDQHHAYKARLNRKEFPANQPILIQLKNEQLNSKVAIQKKSNGTFFHTNLHIPQKYARKKIPNAITVYWDVSSSRLLCQLEKEKKLLRSYLSRMKKGKVELIPFGYKAFPSQQFQIKNGNSTEILKAINQLQYDGATSLHALEWNRSKGDEILLFTDGLQNMGTEKIHLPKKEIYAVQSSVKSNNATLKFLARKTHGAFIDLMQLSEKESLSRLNSKSLHFMGFVKNPALESYFPSKGQGQNGILSVSGKWKNQTGVLVAKFGVGQKVLLKQKLTLNPSKKKNHADFERMWAIQQLNELQENPRENKDRILKTGLHYGLVSDFTSLLILDRIEDYVQHRIVPPKSLQKEYFKRLKQEDNSDKETEKSHLKKIKKAWQEQKSWWFNKHQVNEEKVEHRSENSMNEEVVYEPMNQPVITSQITEGNDEVVFTPPSVDALEESQLPQAQDLSSIELSNGYHLTASSAGATTYAWTNSVNSPSLNYWSGSYSLTVSDMNATSVSQVPADRGSLRVSAWNPKAPYMKRIKSVKLNDAYQVYLEERVKYASQPSFYLDVSDYLISKKRYSEGIKVLTNIAELDLENHSLLRIVAQRLLQFEENKLALSLFKHLILLRPEEPQSYRDLGLAFEKAGNYNEAIRYLYKVVKEPYDGRFEGIHCIALNEINNIISKHPKDLKYDYIDPAFIRKMPVDIRIVLNWDTDDTDVDLWVTEPDGEKCMYSHPLTNSGGRISNDFTQGYGPEEYMIRNAKKGTYHIEAHYYGDHRPSLNGKATLSVQLFKLYGTTMQYKREITRRLNVTNDVVDLGEFEF
jgi:hypothetical protein